LSATSSASGTYEFPQITPGRYELSASSEGLLSLKISNVIVSVGQPATLPIAFTGVDQPTETVEVHAPQHTMNTTDASLGHALGERAIMQLPFNARNVVNMLSLQPGVTFIGDTDQLREDRRAGNVNGGRSDQA